MKVGGTAATLHVEDLHLVCGIVLEYLAELSRLFVVIKMLLQILDQSLVIITLNRIAFLVVLPEDVQKRRVLVIHNHVPGGEVDRPRQGTVNASQIDHQLIVHVQPEVIVTGELKDDVMTPVIKATRRLRKPGFQFHAEIEVCFGGIIDKIQVLVLPWIAIRQQISCC